MKILEKYLMSLLTGYTKSGVCLPRHILTVLAIQVFVVFSATAAAAQDIDWLVNVDETVTPAPAGGLVEVPIRVSNNGADPADPTTVDIVVPATTTFESFSGDITGCSPLPAAAGTTVTCDVPALSAAGTAGSEASILFGVRTEVEASPSITASVPLTNATMQTDSNPDPTNNTQVKTLTFTAGADIVLSVVAPTEAVSGEIVTYVFTATNDGPNDGTDVTFTFPQPAGLADFGPTPAGCTLSSGLYTCIVPTLDDGDSVDFTFEAQVITGGGSSVVGLGNITDSGPGDPDVDNNGQAPEINITEGSDLVMEKSVAGPAPLLVGDQTTFTLSPSYSGDVPADVQVTDTVPGNYTILSVTTDPADGWTCGFNSGTGLVSCARAANVDDEPGLNQALGDIEILVSIDVAGTAENEATVFSTTTDPNPTNNTDDDGGIAIEDPFIDLAVGKSGLDTGEFVVGQSYDFDLTATNVGNEVYTGTIEIRDVIPVGLTVTSVAGWTCLPPTLVGDGVTELVCTRFETLNPNQVSTPAVVTVEATQVGAFVNIARVSAGADSNLPDTNPGNDETVYDGNAELPNDSADITVAKSASPAVLPVGEVLTYDIEVINLGVANSIDVEVSDLLSGLMNTSTGPTGSGLVGLRYTNITEAAADCETSVVDPTSLQLECNIALLAPCTSLANGGSGPACPIISVDVRPGGDGSNNAADTAGQRTNLVTAISQGTPDTDRDNNEATANYEVLGRTDVALLKEASDATIPAGQLLTYLITAVVADDDLSSASNMIIRDTLPLDLTFVSATPTQGTCTIPVAPGGVTGTNANDNELVCVIGDVPNNNTQSVTVRVRPNFDLINSTIVNAARVETDTPQIDTSNDTANVPVAIIASDLDLLIQKTETVDPVATDEGTIYSVTVTNLGPSAAEDIVVTDILPPSNLTILSVLDDGDGDPLTDACTPPITPGGQVGGTITCDYDYLPAGERIVIRVEAEGLTKGTASNTARVVSRETLAGLDRNDGPDSNNQVVETTTVRSRTDVEITSKSVSATEVNLRDPFTYTITAAVNVGTGLGEADNVTVTDDLPAGMELTGSPVATLVQGNATLLSCGGAAGDTTFSCNLGTFTQDLAATPDQPGIVTILVPVRVATWPANLIDVTSDRQTLNNVAEIETTSLDDVDVNNSGNVDVGVLSSTLSGTIFRDFNDDGTEDATDTGVGGITVTLRGVTPDGTMFTRTTTTDPTTGAYTFFGLPQGIYEIEREVITETHQNDGDSYPDGGNGSATSPVLLEGVSLGDNAIAPNNDFTIVPIARISAAKAPNSTLLINADGSFDQRFRIRVGNLGLEPLENVVVTDFLEGGAAPFGTYTVDALTPGTYTIIVAPSLINCGAGTAIAAYDGATNATLATGVTLPAGEVCQVRFTVRVQPTIPLPPIISGTDRYLNQATVAGTGALSGQTSVGPNANPFLTDLSDNGPNLDTNNNGLGNDAYEDDPTPIGPVFAPAIAITKSANITAFSTPPAENDEITYTFTVINTGNIDLQNVMITDPLPGIMITDANIGTLARGDSVVRTATYRLTQANINAGEVVNQATASGADIYGTPATDTSGTTNGDNIPTTTMIDQEPGVAVIKTADDAGIQNPTEVGDEITYTFSVRNTGNVTLTNVNVTDDLPDIVLTPTAGALADLAVMEPGEEVLLAYTGVYAVKPTDINLGRVDNQALATGTDPDNVPTTDDSGDTFGDDNPISVPLFQDPSIALIKTVTTDRLGTPAQEGDELDYQFVVTNTGNVTLTNITITDLLPDVVMSGGPITLDINEFDDTTYTATYALKQADLNLGLVENSATVSGTPPSGPAVTDVSGTDNTDDTPLETTLTQVSEIALIKRADLTDLSNPPEDGELITFRFDVTNTGNQILTDVTVQDLLPNLTMMGGPILTLNPTVTDSTTFTATYPLSQDDIDLGTVTNSATVTSKDPNDDDITDTSGTTNDNDDPLITSLIKDPDIAVVKTIDITALSTPPEVGEVITYNFTVTNIGNVRLTNVTVTDPLTDLVLTGDPIPAMEPGAIDSTTYRATYALKEEDLDAGRIENQATVTGIDPENAIISDLSGDTNLVDNPLVHLLDRVPAITLVKTANTDGFSDPVQEGDIITYAFTITNTGNVTLSNVTLTDILPDIIIDGDPILSLPSMAVDNTTFTASYAVKQTDINLGEVENSATTTGTPPVGVGPDVTDISGTDASNDDPTIVPLPQEPAITLDKIADTSAFLDGSLPGEAITYSFVITNTGNVTLTDVTVTDALAGVTLMGLPIPSMAPGDVDDTTYTAEYIIDQDDIDAGLVINDATVTGDYVDNLTGLPAQVDASDSEEAVVANIEAIPEVYPPFETDGGVTTSILESDLFLNEPVTLDIVTIEVLTSDPEITLDPATGLITVPPGTPAGTYTVTYEICSIEFPQICDSTTETVVQLPIPSIETTKTQELVDNGDGVDGVGDTVQYRITVENTGNVPVTDLVLNDTFTTVDGAPKTLTTGPDFDSADAGSAQGDLAIGETATYTASFIIDVDAVTRGGLDNIVLATALPVFPDDVPGATVPTPITDLSDDGVDSDGNTVDDPTQLLLTPTLGQSPDLTITKTTTANIVVRGQSVPYVLEVRNDSPFAAGPLDIVDTLPRGLLYTQGTATYDSSPADVSVSGAVVRWEDVVIPPLTTVTATLSGTVLAGARSGDHVNTASLNDPNTDRQLVPSSTATVRITPEPVFDCGEVIGKVFHDRNANGYQDGPYDRSAAVTDQNYYGGKGGGKLAPGPVATDEPGIPAARLATVDGTIITTDEFGRYSVPCAALPQDGGTNFILKLDTRSLPSGFRMTTENPRVMRLTPGKLIEMNFGVSISQLVRIDLNANGFVQGANGGLTLAPALAQGIQSMLPQIADTPSHLRLAFHVPASAGSADVAQARAMMALVQRYIDDQWRDIGRAKLTTEQVIARPEQ